MRLRAVVSREKGATCRSSNGAIRGNSPLDAGAAAFEDVHEFFLGDLGGVAAGGLEECTVGGAEVDAVFGGHAGEEAVGEAGGEAVAAADAVFDFEIVEVAGVAGDAV